MSAKFTSDTKGRVINGIKTSIEEANRLMDDDSKTFYVCPGIAPPGFVDFCAGQSMFTAIGTDGKATGDVFLYEVVDEDDPRAISFRADGSVKAGTE
jgi:hypothetical protein